MEEVLTSPDVSDVTLEDAIETLDKRLASLDEIQEDYEVYIEVGEIETEIEEEYEFLKNARKPRQEAMKRLAETKTRRRRIRIYIEVTLLTV